MDYPIALTRDDNDTWLVSVPDFPEAHTFGDTPEEAVSRAADAIATVIDAYVKDRRPIPAPSRRASRYHASLSALTSAKVALYELMRTKHVTKTELGRLLNAHLPVVDRLIDVKHASQMSQLDAAFRVLGKRLVVHVEDVKAVRKSGKRARHVGA